MSINIYIYPLYSPYTLSSLNSLLSLPLFRSMFIVITTLVSAYVFCRFCPSDHPNQYN